MLSANFHCSSLS